MSVERIALELHLKPGTVAAVEEDAYERLPSAVFVSGYIRAYARLLDIDPQPLIERFHRLHPNAEPPPPRVTSQQGRGISGGHLAARLLVSSLAIAAIATLGYWAWKADWPRMAAQMDQPRAPTSIDGSLVDPIAVAPETNDLTTTPAVAGTPGATSASPETRSSDPGPVGMSLGVGASPTADTPDDAMPQPATAASIASTAESEAEAPAQSTIDAEPTAMSAPTEIAPSDASLDEEQDQTTKPEPGGAADDVAQTPAEDGDQIVLTFSGPCWVDVRDADGEVELFGEMADGDRHVLSGPPPFSLILGNATAADVRVGDRIIDVAAIAKGNVARFDLDPDALPATIDEDAQSSPAPGGDPSG